MSEPCRCGKCSRLPRPREIGEAHEVAVVLHLTAEQALDIASFYGPSDLASREITAAACEWLEERDAE